MTGAIDRLQARYNDLLELQDRTETVPLMDSLNDLGEALGLLRTFTPAQAVGMLTRYGEPAIPLAIKAIKAWQANRATSYTPTNILIDCGDAILAALAAQPLAAPVERKRKFTVCGDCGLDEHCGDRCPNTPLARSSAESASERREALAERLHDRALAGLSRWDWLTEPNKEDWRIKADAWIAADLKQKRAHNRKHPLPVTFE